MQQMRMEEELVSGVSLSPAHTFQLRWTNSSEKEGSGQMDSGDSLIPTQVHHHQDCSLYWDGLIPGTKPPGPTETEIKLVDWWGSAAKANQKIMDTINNNNNRLWVVSPFSCCSVSWHSFVWSSELSNTQLRSQNDWWGQGTLNHSKEVQSWNSLHQRIWVTSSVKD